MRRRRRRRELPALQALAVVGGGALTASLELARSVFTPAGIVGRGGTPHTLSAVSEAQGAAGAEAQGVLAAARGEAAEQALRSQGFRPVLTSFHVFVATSGVHGWGVFAGKDFVEGEVLHESPGRIVTGDALEVRDDIFELGWEDPDASNKSILGLGFASLHNHADEPNTGTLWEKSERHGGGLVGTFYALRPIKRGEELFISYGEDWWSDRNDTTKC